MNSTKSGRILSRQLKSLKLDSLTAPNLEQWKALLVLVEGVYEQAEVDRYLQERALSISSREMREALHREKAMSLQLVQASRLTSLGTLASGVAHELNNPLGGVRGYAEMLLESNELTSEDRGRLERIVALVERMSQTVKHLLKLARKPETESLGPVSLDAVVKDSIELFISQLKYDNITLDILLPPGISVVAESHRLISVIQNLIGNARDEFMRDRNKTESPRIVVSIDENQSDENTLCICVSDNAGGIKKEIVDRIFDPFFTTKEVGQGTGLGLSLSRRIVEEFGGRLICHSQNGETSFFIFLKRFAGYQEQVTSISGAVSQVHSSPTSHLSMKKKLLIVDDEPDIIAILEHRLKNSFDVMTSDSSVEAAKLLRERPFDYLVTDLKMPNLGGVELIAVARAANPNIGVTIVSGHAAAAEEISEQIELLGAVLISKPLPDHETFLRLILSTTKSTTSAA